MRTGPKVLCSMSWWAVTVPRQPELTGGVAGSAAAATDVAVVLLGGAVAGGTAADDGGGDVSVDVGAACEAVAPE